MRIHFCQQLFPRKVFVRVDCMTKYGTLVSTYLAGVYYCFTNSFNKLTLQSENVCSVHCHDLIPLTVMTARHEGRAIGISTS